VELYNLRDDISEKNDLADLPRPAGPGTAGKMPQKAAELKAMLTEWRKQVKAKMPASGPQDDFAVFEKARQR
jgi:hypothetical protein